MLPAPLFMAVIKIVSVETQIFSALFVRLHGFNRGLIKWLSLPTAFYMRSSLVVAGPWKRAYLTPFQVILTTE